MEAALEIVAVAVGVLLVAVALGSAIKSVILPRGVPSRVTRAVYLGWRSVFRVIARPSLPYSRKDRTLSFYAPLALLTTLAAWLALTFLGYAAIYWGARGEIDWRQAFELSGSSLFTLGFIRPDSFWLFMLTFTEAAIGLFLLALLITYLPSIYSAFSRREVGVTALAVRAGEPPSGQEMLWRYWVLERMHRLTDVWEEWERWFVDVEESHTSLPALVFFRSPQPDHHWVTAAGAVLDGAAMLLSSVQVEREVQAEFCIRAGYLCLRRIAGFFGLPFDADPAPTDPISVTREEWERAVEQLEAAGLPIKEDRDQAWRDFAGWRVNYDVVLLALANITGAPPAPWSSDRSGDRSWRPRMFGSGVRGVTGPA